VPHQIHLPAFNAPNAGTKEKTRTVAQVLTSRPEQDLPRAMSPPDLSPTRPQGAAGRLPRKRRLAADVSRRGFVGEGIRRDDGSYGTEDVRDLRTYRHRVPLRADTGPAQPGVARAAFDRVQAGQTPLEVVAR
jgi:hypothetical protein